MSCAGPTRVGGVNSMKPAATSLRHCEQPAAGRVRVELRDVPRHRSRRALPAGSPTLAPEDILLTKLQIIEVNNNYLIDGIALLLSRPVASGSEPGINRERLARIVGADWGCCVRAGRGAGRRSARSHAGSPGACLWARPCCHGQVRW